MSREAMSLTDLRKNLFKVFSLLNDGKVTLKIYFRRKVYLFNITPTNEVITKPYKRSKARIKNKIAPESVESRQCPDCKDIMVNGLCMNKDCKLALKR